PLGGTVGMARSSGGGRIARRTSGSRRRVSPLPWDRGMTFVLVRKLLRDIRLPLVVVVVLLIGFQCLWGKITQRTTTQISPFLTTIAARAGVFKEKIEDVLFQGPGKIVQALAGGENIQFDRAMDMLTIGYLHPLMQVIFCVWGIGRAAS